MQPDRRDETSRRALIARARSEYAEMPGLCLTCDQASRLWSVRPDISARVLAQMEGEGLLKRTGDGTYSRTDLGA